MPTLTVLLLLPVLLSLGIWQLQRAEYKRELLQGFDRGGETVYVAGAGVAEAFAELPRYQQVEVTGRYAGDRQFLLDNMTSGGAAGYHVLTPFVPEDAGPWVLVNRGWIPKAFGTTLLPDVAVDESERRVVGRITRLPRPGLELAAGNDSLPEWPRVVQFPTMAALSEALGVGLAPRMVLLDPAAPDGYARDWRPAEFGPERHLGYAVQWFALAAALLIIYVAVNLKRSGDE